MRGSPRRGVRLELIDLMNTSPKTTTAAHFVWLSASVFFWPMLIAGSWAFMPLPLAALNSIVHCLGLFLTAWPAIVHLLHSSRGGERERLASRRALPSGNPFDSFPGQDRTRSPRGRVEASRTILPGSGFTFGGHKEDGVTRLSKETGRRVFLSPGGWPHRLDNPTPDDAA